MVKATLKQHERKSSTSVSTKLLYATTTSLTTPPRESLFTSMHRLDTLFKIILKTDSDPKFSIKKALKGDFQNIELTLVRAYSKEKSNFSSQN